MGMVPVAPSSRRDWFEGERRANGFIDKPKPEGLIMAEKIKKTTLVIMMYLMIDAESRVILMRGLFFNQDPGLATPQ
jgi:hypothetical protein